MRAFATSLALLFAFAALAPLRAAERPAPDLLAEAIVFAPQGGHAPEDAEILRWQTQAQRPSALAATFERLGWAYVAKARVTLDAGYYKLAEKTADAMDARFGASDECRLLRGHVDHNLHRFHDAEQIARALCAHRGLPDDFALLSDALMEQGRLAEAVAALQRMVDLRPGAGAYSRIAHLRWLKGDLPGAIAAMTAAERATGSSEDGAWTRVRLAGYYLQAGDAPQSLVLAESALHQVPDYPPALLARGRALVACGRAADALPVLRRAARSNPLPEYQWWLADALRAAGQADAAAAVEQELRTRGPLSDPRTLALFLASRRLEPAAAVALAREELANRADVFTHDALAWALLASGDAAGAEAEIALALAEHTADARLLWHAGEIALARGHSADASALFARARPLAATLTPGERDALVAHRVLARAAAPAPFPATEQPQNPRQIP